MPSRLELMEIHARVLFRHDTAGRLRDVNEPPHNPAPRWYVGRTADGDIVRYGADVGARVRGDLEQALAHNVDLAAAVAALAAERPVTAISLGPAYAFLDPMRPGRLRTVRVDQAGRDILAPNFPHSQAHIAERQPCYVIVRDGAAVAMCCTARCTEHAAEASVATLAPFRGRGYAATVTRAWAAEVQHGGRLALFSTSWDNFASQGVARRLRLARYGVDVHVT